MKKEEILPMGSVVKIKKFGEKLMIAGVNQKVDYEVFHYAAFIHPYGYVGPKKMLFFNSDAIEKVFIAKQIRIHRKRAGLTQAELAEKVNLSTQHISRIESGCYIPSLTSFFMIVEVLKIDLKTFGFDIHSTNSKRNSATPSTLSSGLTATTPTNFNHCWNVVPNCVWRGIWSCIAADCA